MSDSLHGPTSSYGQQPPATYVYDPDFVPILPQDKYAQHNLYSMQYSQQCRRAIDLGRSIPLTVKEQLMVAAAFAVICLLVGIGSLFI